MTETRRTVGDVIADLRLLATILPGTVALDGASTIMREAADLLEQMVPSSALLPEVVPS